MMYYLGIDGGGTKTKFSLCDEKGVLKTSIEETTCHYLQVGFDGVTKIINQGLDNVCKANGIKREDIAYAFAGMPGYGDAQRDMAPIKEAVKKAMQTIPFSIGNDGENALAGALCCKDGINIVAGTGSIVRECVELEEAVKTGKLDDNMSVELFIIKYVNKQGTKGTG